MKISFETKDEELVRFIWHKMMTHCYNDGFKNSDIELDKQAQDFIENEPCYAHYLEEHHPTKSVDKFKLKWAEIKNKNK